MHALPSKLQAPSSQLAVTTSAGKRRLAAAHTGAERVPQRKSVVIIIIIITATSDVSSAVQYIPVASRPAIKAAARKHASTNLNKAPRCFVENMAAEAASPVGTTSPPRMFGQGARFQQLLIASMDAVTYPFNLAKLCRRVNNVSL